MATLQDLAQQASQGVVQAAPRLALLRAQTALALVTFRVQSQGVAGPGYSTTPVPSFLFTSKAFNAGGRAYIKKNKLGTYKGFRDALGLPTAYVNLTFTGRMFRSLQASAAGVSGAVAQARIVASTQEDADKVGYNTKQRGDFLAPNAAERAEIAAVTQREVTRIINSYFQV
ncbi:hypothetical protein BEN47_06120 [Hymenobacter lapidarius]|uniref:Uncharacterized protein n=1 Tax=Hymenobacter lapidarius TaxID=1908237 RepID=A0A1G1SQD2_9BACT|nr:hypothetical protein [Hymenobacter lapidarius]OGX80830.1 hypothetical protein BEN47_06120 [Hymenobacter lapidarius]